MGVSASAAASTMRRMRARRFFACVCFVCAAWLGLGALAASHACAQPRGPAPDLRPEEAPRVAAREDPPSPVVPPARAPRTDANFVHFELLGNAGLYSLNYTRRVVDAFSARIGISYVALGASISRTSARADALTVPVLLHYLGVAKGAHKLELGLGPLLVYGSARARLSAREALRARFRVLASATIGYRYLPSRGFTFNVGFTPVFGPVFLPWAGIGVGHTF